MNDLFLFALAMFMLVGLTTAGMWIKERFLRLPTEKIFDVIMNLGIGMSAFLVVNYLLILGNVFYSVISWILFVGMCVLMRLYRERLTHMWSIVNERLGFFSLRHDIE